jgi:hypothetical protein
MSAEHGISTAAQESDHATRRPVDPVSPPAATSALPCPTVSRLLTDPAIRGRGNSPVRQAAIHRMQQTLGNRATQRVLQRLAQPAAPARQTGEGESAPPGSPAGQLRSLQRALDPPWREKEWNSDKAKEYNDTHLQVKVTVASKVAGHNNATWLRLREVASSKEWLHEPNPERYTAWSNDVVKERKQALQDLEKQPYMADELQQMVQFVAKVKGFKGATWQKIQEVDSKAEWLYEPDSKVYTPWSADVVAKRSQALAGGKKGAPEPEAKTGVPGLNPKYSVVKEVPGFAGKMWYQVRDEGDKHWLYEPDTTIYTAWSEGTKGSPGVVKTRIAERTNEAETAVAAKYEEYRKSAAFTPKKPTPPLAEVKQELEDAVGEPNWAKLGDDIKTRAPRVFKILLVGFIGGKIEVTSDLLLKMRATREPLGKPELAEKDAKQVSEALSELEHVANLVEKGTPAHPVVLGAQGPKWSPGQTEDIGAEETHGQLPLLDIVRLEVDAYYQTQDGVLHADEVKDTPRAMAVKVLKGGQLQRQVQWLKAKTEQATLKQVGYFVQAPGPGFDQILNATVIANLTLIDTLQKSGLKFINIAGREFAIQELEQLMTQALEWLRASKAVFAAKMDFTQAAETYFGNVNEAMRNLQQGPLKDENDSRFSALEDLPKKKETVENS